jgi:hypothetical protein
MAGLLRIDGMLSRTEHDEFAGLFSFFVCERGERLEEYSSGSFYRSRWQQRVRLEVQSWSCLAVAYGSGMAPFQENRSCRRLERGPAVFGQIHW